ncbi:hypothetical protein DRN69_03665 [Candidatus Pacearchaeota archaeon]|nr:MAG: hypothetical protein DRN69_03665 [Candidatus Pacearchaeota archaeon]
MELEPGDIVMCTVERIEGTVVFVKIDGNGEGSIIVSEIAPGRIRNLRDYVVPKKRIVCKVLRISSNGNIELSLRRVAQKEKKEAIEQDKQEKGYKNVLKSVLKDDAEKVIKDITKKGRLYDFIEEAKENKKILENLIGKKDAERILEILKSQKKKKTSIKKEIFLTTTNSDGLKLIKEIFSNVKGYEIRYIAAGRYLIKTESEDPKTADNKLKEILSYLENVSKQKGLNFGVKEK